MSGADTLKLAREALTSLLNRDQRNTCQHENTHRGGAIWEICDDCGAQWADDRGGKPKWKDPPEWAQAEEAIAALSAAPAGEPVAELQRIKSALHMEGPDASADPVAVINMLRSWEADAQRRSELLEQHLRSVLEVAKTWQPDYATKMDRDTLEHAQESLTQPGAAAAPVAQQAAPLPRQADPLTQAIQRLNSSPYSLTKGECIQVLMALRHEMAEQAVAQGAKTRSTLTRDLVNAAMLLKRWAEERNEPPGWHIAGIGLVQSSQKATAILKYLPTSKVKPGDSVAESDLWDADQIVAAADAWATPRLKWPPVVNLVGLSDERIMHLWFAAEPNGGRPASWHYARSVERALAEANGLTLVAPKGST